MGMRINYSIAGFNIEQIPLFMKMIAIAVILFIGCHGAMSTHDMTGYDSCLCNKLFDILVDVKAKWNANIQKVEQLEKKVKQLENQKSSEQDGSCKLPIAFYAMRDATTLVSGGNTIDFKKVITNTCNVYDNTTSTFTCPSDGVYVFHYFALDAADGLATYLLLKKNSNTVAHTWSKGKSASETGANTAILNLVKGDKVYIIAGSGYPAKTCGSYTTFSGFKLN